MENTIKVLSVAETVERLKSAGLRDINPERLRLGIEQKVYPFGIVVQMSGRRVIEIYSALLERWIEERCG